ncbi:carbohydrate-responsive element-binding protein-like isoform X3 [Brienomyrus brachyistius]|uniref:carbohydrate-responsive element-binding protein-like isoform X3 n=1 Tax=Brienomyrus brachyistius TaxID=42636 RepID=UPI0020B19836|nr:carbohydrate-responsive element-binding protein-like isoform X3 [Brienomyrus brachyistius]
MFDRSLLQNRTPIHSGKIVSPKWKSFKGLRLLWRDKIRLNNGIWRAWYIQYVEKRRNPVCGFVTPLEGSEADAHRKPEAIILEGSYWKRRIEVVIKEYHKWRIYYKKRLQKHKDGILSILEKDPVGGAARERWSGQLFQESKPTAAEGHMFDLDCFLSDISDTLFTMTQKSCPWAEDGHNTYSSNADMIQPGLTPLQPILDDFMDIPDFFSSCRGQPLDQVGIAECGYFGSLPGSSFPVPPSLVPPVSLLPADTQLLQANLSSESRDRMVPVSSSEPCYHRPVTSEMTFNPSSITPEAKYKGQMGFSSQDEYPGLSLVPGTMSYGQQSFMNAAPVATEENSDLYATACLKYRYSSPAAASVITHTGSSVGVLDPLTHGYPDPEVFTAGPYPTPSFGPLPTTHTAPPPPAVRLGFLETQRVSGRGKYKQKSPGMKSSAPLASPTQSSCLAKLLSGSRPERKLALGFDRSSAEAKGRSSTSPSHPAGVTVTSIQHSPPRAPPGPRPGLLQGSAISALLSQNSLPGCAPLLVPKTEQLSPIQSYGSERASLTAERSSGLQASHSFSRQPKMEATKTESRRITHISAEQKRRFNIKLGFDTLQSLVTTLSAQPGVKISKATTLQKTAEYIGKVQQERTQLHEEAQRLREEIVGLNSAINLCQQQLPATGVPITRQRFDHMRAMFREYVRAQTLQNWKFWIFSVIIEPLFESYNGMVSTASVEDLCRTTLSWLDRHCSLPALRPAVLSSLRLLSTSTSILTDPSLVPEQATIAVTQAHPSSEYS